MDDVVEIEPIKRAHGRKPDRNLHVLARSQLFDHAHVLSHAGLLGDQRIESTQAVLETGGEGDGRPLRSGEGFLNSTDQSCGNGSLFFQILSHGLALRLESREGRVQLFEERAETLVLKENVALQLFLKFRESRLSLHLQGIGFL